ncbi:MAG: type II CAAX endopeptidase family protein [Elainellaceae cyanobacterium]
MPIAIPLGIFLKWNFWRQPITPSQKIPLVISLYLLAPAVLWLFATLDGATFADYGLPWQGSTLRSMLLGLGIGAIGLIMMFGLQWQLGWLHWHSLSSPTTAGALPQDQPENVLSHTPQNRVILLLAVLGLATWISLIEELVFRGFLINQLQHNFAAWVAATIASLIFAGLHLIWEGKDNLPQLPGLWLMGMVLVLARWVDGGNLGLAWGLHAGWVWLIATTDSTQAITYTGKGATWLRGLVGKPLAGVFGILFLLGTGGVLWLLGSF